MVVEVCVACKCNTSYLSYNANESSENVYEYCMEIKTILPKVLTELSPVACGTVFGKGSNDPNKQSLVSYIFFIEKQ
jgi:hypothetical protein